VIKLREIISRSEEKGGDNKAGGSNSQVDSADQNETRGLFVGGWCGGGTFSDPQIFGVFGLMVDGVSALLEVKESLIGLHG
jgi:uncharacterized membrane protein